MNYSKRWNPKCGKVYKLVVEKFKEVGDKPTKVLKKKETIPVTKYEPRIVDIKIRPERFIPYFSWKSRKRYVIYGIGEHREVLESIYIEDRKTALYILKELEDLYELR